MMSRQKQVRARSNGEDRLENDPAPVETQSNDPNDAPASRLPHGSDQRGTLRQSGGGDLRGYAQVVARYPLATLVASLSAGFGLGILATAVFTRENKAWWERHNLPESFYDVSSGLRRIPGMIAQHLPDSLAPVIRKLISRRRNRRSPPVRHERSRRTGRLLVIYGRFISSVVLPINKNGGARAPVVLISLILP